MNQRALAGSSHGALCLAGLTQTVPGSISVWASRVGVGPQAGRDPARPCPQPRWATQASASRGLPAPGSRDHVGGSGQDGRSRKARAGGPPRCWGTACPRPCTVLRRVAHGTYPVTGGGSGSAGLLGALRTTAAKGGCPTADQSLGGTVGKTPCPGGSRFLRRSRLVAEEPRWNRPLPSPGEAAAL